MAKASAPATVASLLEKGDGILIKRNGVWTYPSAPNDRSGTNLVLPIEFVSDAAVQEAIKAGDLVTKATDTMGAVTSVSKPAPDGATILVVNMMQAGSVEAATELPLNSRPTHDAGRSDREVPVAEAQTTIESKKVPQPPGSAVVATAPAGGPAQAPAAKL